MCNKDCFNCVHPDCINDKLDYEEYKDDVAVEDIDKSVLKNREYSNRYAKKNREAIRERSIKNYYDNKELYNARSRKWAKENKDRAAASKRERYHKNIEESRKKQREYRARKRLEVN